MSHVAPNNLLFTCSIPLSKVAPWIAQNDPPALHVLDEALAKMDRFCHKIYKVPITWLCNYAALEKHGETLARFVRDHGDEVAIFEMGGIMTRASLRGEEREYQGWVEACGLSRPDEFHSAEPGLIGARGFHDMPFEEQKTALTYLKKFYDERLGQNTRTFANPFINDDSIRAMSEVGLDVTWAHNWDYFCEGINNKGCLPYPFYIHPKNHNVPAVTPQKNSVIAVHWGPISPVIMNHVDTHSRTGLPGYCLNSLEMTNRADSLGQFDHHRKVIEEYASWGKWNPFMHIPLQLEGVWIDETPMPPEQYVQFPTFNAANTETFYTQIETCLRTGAKPLTLSGFADWHRKNIGDTTEMIWYSVDPLPEVRGKGKNQAYEPFVVFGSKKYQYWFDQNRGFNYVRKYEYEPVVSWKEIEYEYPFLLEPKVYLSIKHQNNVRAGITLDEEKAAYELIEFDLTAYEADPTYAGIIWSANIPSYIKDSDLKAGGAITGFRTVREKNFAILFADLKKGFNPMSFTSDIPQKYIRIVSVERVGGRYEIWIQNDGEPVALHQLRCKLPKNLKFGGYWWDGHYSRTLYNIGWGTYERNTGDFELKVFYPHSLPVNTGLTRCSLELL